MTIGYETQNLVFVPAGAELSIVDLARWRVARLDTLGCHAQVREQGLAMVDAAARHFLARAAKRDAPKAAQWKAAAEAARFDLEAYAGPEAIALATIDAIVPGLSAWIRFTDRAAESFDPEDYDEARAHEELSDAFPVFGALSLEEAGGLEAPLPGMGPDAPIWLVAPQGSLRLEELDALAPLPVVAEYCGVEGVSARGFTTNLHYRAEVSPEHTFCTPLRRVGDTLFATLYFHLSSPWEGGPLALALSAAQLERMGEVLGRSRFEVVQRGDNWTILRRGGDVLHFYTGLPGRESAGALTIQPFLLAASAGGDFEPAARAALLANLAQALG